MPSGAIKIIVNGLLLFSGIIMCALQFGRVGAIGLACLAIYSRRDATEES